MVVMVVVVVVITLSVPMVVKCTRLDSFVRERESEDSNPGCQGNCNSLHPQSSSVVMMMMVVVMVMITVVMLMLVPWQLSNQE